MMILCLSETSLAAKHMGFVSPVGDEGSTAIVAVQQFSSVVPHVFIIISLG
jgi:hypothetical protein